MFIKSENGAVLDTSEIVMVGRHYDGYYSVIFKSGLDLTFSETNTDADFMMSRADLLKKWLDKASISSDNFKHLTSDD